MRHTHYKLELEKLAGANNVSLSTVYRVKRGSWDQDNPVHVKLRAALSGMGALSRMFSPLMLVLPPVLTSHAYALIRFLRKLCASEGLELVNAMFDSYREELSRTPSIAGALSMTPLNAGIDIPCVYLNLRDITGRCGSVSVDMFGNMLAMLSHLKKSGGKRIALFFPGGASGGQYAKHGLIDVPLAYKTAGLECHRELIQMPDVNDMTHFDICSMTADHLLSLKNPPDACIASSDIYGCSLASALKKTGGARAAEIAVASLDDSRLWPLPEERIGPIMTRIYAETAPMAITVTPLRDMAASALAELKKTIENHETKPVQILFRGAISDSAHKRNRK